MYIEWISIVTFDFQHSEASEAKPGADAAEKVLYEMNVDKKL